MFIRNLHLLILIYTEHITARLQYILQELFNRRLGIVFQLTTSAVKIEQYSGAKINYSHNFINGCLHLKPHSILFDETIEYYSVSAKHDNYWDTLIWEQNGDVPFELFAASFFLLSRYEEYLPHKVDEHGRFDAEQSLAMQYGFIETPLVDKWAYKLKEILERQFGKITANAPSYRFISTFDIDTAYLYKGLENYRQLRKTIKSATLLRFHKLAEQVKVLHQNQPDPYDTYEYIAAIAKGKQVKYFALCGGNTEYDEGIPLEKAEMQQLLKLLSTQYDIGLHPSYDAFNAIEMLKEEKDKLEQIIGKKVITNRQHFLRFKLPNSMNNLIQLGFTEDYSMGYGSTAGFRASTCHPFYFFDLELNKITPLLLYSVCVMDVTLKINMNLTVQTAIQKIEQLIQEVKQVNGTLVSIWHNSNLSHTDDWYAWREVFEKLHKLA